MTPDEIKAFRAAHGLSQVACARLIGVAPGTLRNWEQGIRRIPATVDVILPRATKSMIANARRRAPSPTTTGAEEE